MKIFFPFAASDIGGTSVFSRRFKAGMEARGHEVFHAYREDYDLLFMIVQAPFKYLWDARRRGKPIVQRLDGTYYWSVAGPRFPLYNLKATLARQCFTDFTIYQSKYSRFCTNRFLGKKFSDRSALIYNGVDTELFHPEGKVAPIRDNPDQRIFFSSSDFRRTDQIVPILETLKLYREQYGSNFKFVVAGRFRGEAVGIPKIYQDFHQVVFLGTIPNTDLPLYERAADTYVITHLNPPCPNNVIEALACGLPICGIRDGAMSELVRDGETGILLDTQGQAFWRHRKLDLPTFAANLYHLAHNKTRYTKECRAEALSRFQLNTMLEKYESILKSLV